MEEQVLWVDLHPSSSDSAAKEGGPVFQIRYAAFGLLLAAAATYSVATSALPVEHGEYKLPASFDSEVTTDLETEEWARVWRPVPDAAYPLIIMLHGNHGTCGYYDPVHKVRIDDNDEYTYDGTCPSGYVVAPSHLGYDYMANDLASHGYVVVSINANRGVNAAPGVDGDEGLNLRRGRLVLRHMQYLSEWNTSGGAPDSLGFQLTGILDFDHVGLMGHSRGGEGMRAAVAQYQDPGSPWPPLVQKAHLDHGVRAWVFPRPSHTRELHYRQFRPDDGYVVGGRTGRLRGAQPICSRAGEQ
jgi:hypothetical protein